MFADGPIISFLIADGLVQPLSSPHGQGKLYLAYPKIIIMLGASCVRELHLSALIECFSLYETIHSDLSPLNMTLHTTLGPQKAHKPCGIPIALRFASFTIGFHPTIS